MSSPGNARNGNGGGGSIELAKKSPMNKLARLARLAGTSLGKDAINSSGTDWYLSQPEVNQKLWIVFNVAI